MFTYLPASIFVYTEVHQRESRCFLRLRLGKHKTNFFPREQALNALLYIQRMNKVNKQTDKQTNKQTNKYVSVYVNNSATLFLLNTANARQIRRKIRTSVSSSNASKIASKSSPNMKSAPVSSAIVFYCIQGQCHVIRDVQAQHQESRYCLAPLKSADFHNQSPLLTMPRSSQKALLLGLGLGRQHYFGVSPVNPGFHMIVQSSQNRTKRSGRLHGNTTETTETTRTIGTITIAWIASSSIRMIGSIGYGNHSRMTRTIEAIQTYPKMHRLFQDSMLILHCVPKWHNKHERVETKLLHQCMVPLGLYALFYRTLAKITLPHQALNRAVSLFETIEAIIWKPKVASIVLIVLIASKHDRLRRWERSGRSYGNQA